MRDAGFQRPRPLLDIFKHFCGEFLHDRRLAAREAAGPQAVIDGKTFQRLLAGRREFARAAERRFCFGRVTAQRDQRVAIGSLQSQPIARRWRAGPLVRHLNGLAEMGYGLLKG